MCDRLTKHFYFVNKNDKNKIISNENIISVVKGNKNNTCINVSNNVTICFDVFIFVMFQFSFRKSIK